MPRPWVFTWVCAVWAYLFWAHAGVFRFDHIENVRRLLRNSSLNARTCSSRQRVVKGGNVYRLARRSCIHSHTTLEATWEMYSIWWHSVWLSRICLVCLPRLQSGWSPRLIPNNTCFRQTIDDGPILFIDECIKWTNKHQLQNLWQHL